MRLIKATQLFICFVFCMQTISLAQLAASHLNKGMQVLFIGDSNTEIGNITIGLSEVLDSAYGDYGTGYCTINPHSVGLISDSLKINCDSGWTYFDMRDAMQPEQPPYYSPNGLSISSSKQGVTTTVEFNGDAIDLYYLQTKIKGSFIVLIDGIKKATIHSKGHSIKTKKIVIDNLNYGHHVMRIKNEGGNITLLGIDVKAGNAINKRYVVHKWGNAWSSSQEFLGVDNKVFSTRLQLLNPTLVIILIGTNDYNLDNRSPENFKNNLEGLVVRIKKALPSVPVLIISTFDTEGEKAKTILSRYVTTSFPYAAKATGAYYWNMYKWFGSYNSEKLDDGVHVKRQYGKQIAEKIFRVINDLKLYNSYK